MHHLFRALLNLQALVVLTGLASATPLSLGAAESSSPLQSPAACRSVQGAPGPEDLTWDAAASGYYISSDDRRAAAAGKATRGEVYFFQPREEGGTDQLKPLTAGAPTDFHPHGISLYTAPDGRRWLFVINHRENGGNTLERFAVQDGVLAHLETIAYPSLTSPNDVVAVGERMLYASNDTGTQKGLPFVIEVLTARPWASLSYWDGSEGRLIQKRLRYANGVTTSRDGKRLYLSEVSGRTVSIFDRDLQTGALTLKRRIQVPGGPDNIELDPQGRLWVALHPDSFAFVKHAKDAKNPSPFRIVRIDAETGALERVMEDDGKRISAVSTASVGKHSWLMGGVFESTLLVCPPLP